MKKYAQILSHKLSYFLQCAVITHLLLIFFTFQQILKQKSENEDKTDTFIGRLIDVSKKNPKFTMEDVLAETATILTGVFYSIFQYNLIEPLIISNKIINLQFPFIHRQPIHHRLHQHAQLYC